MAANPDSKNAYEILGVPADATVPMIRQAFRKLALKHHPDAAAPEQKEQAAAVFARINQAHELLRDPDKRRKYDALLERGIVPDISKEVGDIAGYSSLGQIIGDIQGLKMDVKSKQILAGMDLRLRDELLLGALIKADDASETVLDALTVSAIVESRNHETPPGVLKEAWIAVTELRIFVLMKYVHEYQDGNVKYTNIYWRSRAFPYLSLKTFFVHESGRAFRSYSLELEDEDGTYFRLNLSAPRLTRLFLVANTYKLPLKIQAKGTSSDEYGTAILVGLFLPLLLWSIPFMGSTCINMTCAICNSKEYKPDAFLGAFDNYADIYGWLNNAWITTILVYGAPLLTVGLWLTVYRAWNIARGDQVFGSPRTDYASIGRDAPKPERAPEPVPKAPPPPVKKQERPPKVKPAAEPPAVDAPPAAQAPSDLPDWLMGQVAAPVVTPSPKPAPAPKPAPVEKVVAFCTFCGQKYNVPATFKGAVTCKKCGKQFPIM